MLEFVMCSVVNVVVILVSFLFCELHISCVVVLTVNPSVYVELVTFCISEWLAVFSFLYPFTLLFHLMRQWKL